MRVVFGLVFFTLSLLSSATRYIAFSKEDPNSEGHWGRVSSSIDWCEKNYDVTIYIAEFWNTVSNLGLFLLGLFGGSWKYYYGFERRWVLMDFSISLVGIGSALFHGTLLFESQLADELPMLYAMMICVYGVLELKKERKMNLHLVYFLVIFSSIWTLMSPIVHFKFNFIFQATFVSLCIFCAISVRDVFSQTKSSDAKLVFNIYRLSVIPAVVFWLIDYLQCDLIQTYLSWLPGWRYIGSLHGYWHIFMAINVYFGSIFISHARADWLAWNPTILWLGPLPYVKATPTKH